MSKNSKNIPAWAEPTLQGLAYWIGHRHSLYKGYPLSEAALIAEACNLIQANLNHDSLLICERMYRTLYVQPLEGLEKKQKIRADLVIAQPQVNRKRADESICDEVQFIIEVKRGDSLWTLIRDDMKRLYHAITRGNPVVRGFLFVICENRPNPRFFDKGESIKTKRRITEEAGYYRVLRTWKAAPRYKNRTIGHYAILIEVFRN